MTVLTVLMVFVWPRRTARGKMRDLCSWSDFSLHKVCVSPHVHLDWYQSKCVTEVKDLVWMMHYSFIPTLIWGSCVIEHSYILAGFISQMHLGFLRCFWWLVVVTIHLPVHSHVHKIFCSTFAGQTKSRTGVWSVPVRTSPLLRVKWSGGGFPSVLIFCSVTPRTFLVFPWGP